MNFGLPELLILFGPVALIALAMIMVTLALRAKHARALQRALIDKLPAEDLASFLRSPHGEKLILSLSPTGASPLRSVLRAVQRGIIATVVGGGLLLAAVLIRQREALVWAIILISLGIGQLLASLASYRLARRLHLIEDHHAGAPDQTAG